MVDIRSTCKYRKDLTKGIIDNKLLERKDTYTLSALLPPITDYIYDPITDTWNRYTDKEKHVIKEHNLKTTDVWNNYGFSFGDKKEQDTQNGSFWINEIGETYFKVIPLEKDDTNCYVTKIYHGGLFERIFGNTFVTKHNEYVIDIPLYMRLRCVCKTFRDMIDKSPILLYNRGRIVREAVKNKDVTGISLKEPREIQLWITLYTKPYMCFTILKNLPILIFCVIH